MVYGELGRFPLGIYNYVKLRIINYWAILLTGKQEKILAILYNFSLLNNTLVKKCKIYIRRMWFVMFGIITIL
jgi:hypothetical protein